MRRTWLQGRWPRRTLCLRHAPLGIPEHGHTTALRQDIGDRLPRSDEASAACMAGRRDGRSESRQDIGSIASDANAAFLRFRPCARWMRMAARADSWSPHRRKDVQMLVNSVTHAACPLLRRQAGTLEEVCASQSGPSAEPGQPSLRSAQGSGTLGPRSQTGVALPTSRSSCG